MAMAELLDVGRRVPAAFLQWWFDELRGLLPRSLGAKSASSKSSLVLNLSGDEIALLERTARHGEKELERAGRDLLDAPEFRAGGPTWASFSARRYRKWPVIIRLGGDLGLRKVIDLPLAARDDLGQLLNFELDRLTPFKADDVCFAWRVLATDNDNKRMQVELEMAPKAVVDQAMALVGRHGREASRVELDGGADRQSLNLLPRSTEEKESKGWLRRLLPLIALGLAAAAIILPLNKQQRLLEEIDREMIAVRAEAEESLAIRKELDGLTEMAGFLAGEKNRRSTMTEILAELTRVIPDHSHIIQLQIKDAKIELNGLADKASDLIAILDQSEMLASPQFRSPVTRDPRANKERFQIAVDVKERSP